MKQFTNLIIIISFLIFGFHNLYGQEDTTGSFNMMKAPANPAFELMGINPTEINTPTDPTDFAVSILNTSNNLSAIPQNFAMSFAPGWVFAGKKMQWDDFVKGKNNFLQSLTVSVGTSSGQSKAGVTQTGIGVNFSILRGTIDESNFKGLYKSLADMSKSKSGLQDKARNQNAEYMRNDSLLRGDLNQEQFDSISKRNTELDDLFKLEYQPQLDAQKDLIDKQTQKIDFTRKGLNISVSLGTVIDYPGQSFQNSAMSRAGGWITTSYTDKNFDGLVLVRGLYNPDSYLNEYNQLETKDIFNFDLGGKFNYKKDKLSLSLEGIFRFYPGVSNPASTYKVVVNANYAFAANKVLTFTYGKDFDGTVTKANNLIASLNVLLGFGSNR